jgi:hypothetical protein
MFRKQFLKDETREPSTPMTFIFPGRPVIRNEVQRKFHPELPSLALAIPRFFRPITDKCLALA